MKINSVTLYNIGHRTIVDLIVYNILRTAGGEMNSEAIADTLRQLCPNRKTHKNVVFKAMQRLKKAKLVKSRRTRDGSKWRFLYQLAPQQNDEP
jgi:DNA-binding PadR family transcriptional regulator